MCKKIVIDVEMCGVKNRHRNFPLRNEIIQIGAVMLDDEFRIVDKFVSYVRPEYGEVDDFITELTGISSHDTQNAPVFSEAISLLKDWIGIGEVMFYAWSDSDYYQIRNELKRKIPEMESFTMITDKACWTDYQKIAGKRFDYSRQLGLSDALYIAEVTPEGRVHDGLDDATNTAMLISKLEMHPEFTPTRDGLQRVEYLDHTPLSTSLGSLLQGVFAVG